MIDYIKRIICLVMVAFLGLNASPPKPVKKGPVFVEIITRFGIMKVLLYDDTPKHRDNFIKLVKQGFYDSLTFHSITPNYTAQGGEPTSKYATEDSVIGGTDLGYRIPPEFRPNLYHRYGALVASRDRNPDMASDASQFFLVKGMRHKYEELVKIEDYKSQRIKSDILYLLMQSDTARARIDDFTLRGDKEGMKSYIASFQQATETVYNKRGPFRFTEQQIQDYTSIGGIPQLDSGFTVFGQVVSNIQIIDSICAQPVAKNKRPLKDIRMKIRMAKK